MATVFKRKGAKTWTVKWYDHDGKRRQKSSRTTDKRAAERIANELQSKASLRRERVIDPTQDQFNTAAQRPIREHVNAYAIHLHDNRSEGHAQTTTGRLDTLLDAAGVTTLAGLTPDTVERTLQRLSDERGLSDRTRNFYLTVAKSFCNWLVKRKQLPDNPLRHVEQTQLTESEYRRALTADEAAWLIDQVSQAEPQRGLTAKGKRLADRGKTVPAGEVRWQLSGPERATLYQFTVETALRRGAIERLTVADVDIDDATVTVQAKARTNFAAIPPTPWLST